MSSVVVKLWNVYCTFDNKWTTIYAKTAPTTCPENNGHSIDTGKTYSSEEISQNIVIIKEEDTPTGGHFGVRTVKLTCPANATSTHTLIWPHPITGLGIGFNSQDIHQGDLITMAVFKNVITGVIIAPVAVGSKTIYVSPTVLLHVNVGYFFKLFNGIYQDDLGRVIGIDKVSNKITVELPTVHAFNPGTFVQQTIKMLQDFELGMAGHYDLGGKKIGGSYVPANTPISVDYVNKSNIDKVFLGWTEFLY